MYRKTASVNVNIVPLKGNLNVVEDSLSEQRITIPVDASYPKEIISRMPKEKFQVNNASTLIPGNLLVKICENEYLRNPEFKSMFVGRRETFVVKNSLLYFGPRL